MVGRGVLRECLRDLDVTEVVSVVRTATGAADAKLREIAMLAVGKHGHPRRVLENRDINAAS
jgi:repressor of nif and glnA expression